MVLPIPGSFFCLFPYWNSSSTASFWGMIFPISGRVLDIFRIWQSHLGCQSFEPVVIFVICPIIQSGWGWPWALHEAKIGRHLTSPTADTGDPVRANHVSLISALIFVNGSKMELDTYMWHLNAISFEEKQSCRSWLIPPAVGYGTSAICLG
jgi:hypothetical protein